MFVAVMQAATEPMALNVIQPNGSCNSTALWPGVVARAAVQPGASSSDGGVPSAAWPLVRGSPTLILTANHIVRVSVTMRFIS